MNNFLKIFSYYTFWGDERMIYGTRLIFVIMIFICYAFIILFCKSNKKEYIAEGISFNTAYIYSNKYYGMSKFRMLFPEVDKDKTKIFSLIYTILTFIIWIIYYIKFGLAPSEDALLGYDKTIIYNETIVLFAGILHFVIYILLAYLCSRRMQFFVSHATSIVVPLVYLFNYQNKDLLVLISELIIVFISTKIRNYFRDF